MIQIIGTKKCKDTAKALRFFKERRVQHQFVDLNERALSKGELNNILRHIDIEDLIDKDSNQFKKRNLEYMVYEPMEEILNDPLIMATPVVRTKQKSVLGHDPDAWKKMCE